MQNSEYDQEIPQSQTADKDVASRGREEELHNNHQEDKQSKATCSLSSPSRWLQN